KTSRQKIAPTNDRNRPNDDSSKCAVSSDPFPIEGQKDNRSKRRSKSCPSITDQLKDGTLWVNGNDGCNQGNHQCRNPTNPNEFLIRSITAKNSLIKVFATADDDTSNCESIVLIIADKIAAN